MVYMSSSKKKKKKMRAEWEGRAVLLSSRAPELWHESERSLPLFL